MLDFSSFFATAYGAKLLSDLGADVIKVETLSGDQMRPMPDLFEASNRGKRNLAVDLKSAAGREVVARLVATADVVMHNLRPGKAEKLGIGHAELVRVRPDLVYCYLPGFGSAGPKAPLKSFAPLVSGFTGLLYEGAGEGNPPIRRVMGNEDYYNGFLGAVGGAAGPRAPRPHGRGAVRREPPPALEPVRHDRAVPRPRRSRREPVAARSAAARLRPALPPLRDQRRLAGAGLRR